MATWFGCCLYSSAERKVSTSASVTGAAFRDTWYLLPKYDDEGFKRDPIGLPESMICLKADHAKTCTSKANCAFTAQPNQSRMLVYMAWVCQPWCKGSLPRPGQKGSMHFALWHQRSYLQDRMFLGQCNVPMPEFSALAW